MKSDFWLARWQDDQIGFHQPEVNPYLRAHWSRLELDDESSIFVPMCGKSIDMLWLKNQGHTVFGVELSELAVKQFNEENQLNLVAESQGDFSYYKSSGLTFACGDYFKLTKEMMSPVTAVFDRAALVAMPPEMRDNYVAHMRAILPRPVKILLVTMEYPESEMEGPPFSISESEVHRLYGDHFHIEQLQHENLELEDFFIDRGLTSLEERVWLLSTK